MSEATPRHIIDVASVATESTARNKIFLQKICLPTVFQVGKHPKSGLCPSLTTQIPTTRALHQSESSSVMPLWRIEILITQRYRTLGAIQYTRLTYMQTDTRCRRTQPTRFPRATSSERYRMLVLGRLYMHPAVHELG